MTEWKEDILGSVLEIKYGKDHKKLSNGNIPCYGSGGLMRYVSEQLYDKESILIPRKGSLNNVMFQNKPFWTVDTMFWSKINITKVFPKFLFYQLILIDYSGLNVGSAVPSLTVPIINEIDIKLPPLPEQKAIAEVLSSLDDKIDLLHRQNKTLEEMAETLFREWFTEPSKKFSQNAAKKPSLNPSQREGDDVWEVPIDETTIQIIDGDRGKNYPKNKDFFSSEYCLFLNAKNITRKGFDFSNCSFISKEKDSLLNKGKLQYNDLVLTTRGTVGNFAFYNKYIPFQNIRINSGMIIFRSKEIPPLYLFTLMKSKYFSTSIRESISGSAQPQLPIRDIKNINVIIPPKKIMNQFVNIIRPNFEKVHKNKRQIASLEKMRDTLLPKLMSGEVRVN